MGAKKRHRIRSWCKRGAVALLVLALVSGGLLWWSLPNVQNLAKENPKTTAFIELRKEEADNEGKRLNLRWKWRRLGQISDYLQHAVITAEDAKFWQHEGVDWDAMEQVAKDSWRDKKFSRGGSTITQQLAKNLYLSPSKNPIRKVREFFIARSLEKHLSKERILEIYLNVAEWGNGVFGAEAAARKWFDVSANELTPAQAARLAVALPNPKKRPPRRKARWLDKKAGRLVRAMRRSGLITDEQYDQSMGDLDLDVPATK